MTSTPEQYDIASFSCPFCGKLQNAATALTDAADEHPPRSGDLSFCFDCGEWCAYNADMTLRPCNDAELDYIGSDPECRHLRAAWVQHRSKQG